MEFPSPVQVLPLWYCVPGGGKDLRHARSGSLGRKVGHVLHHGPVRLVRARPDPAATLLLLLHSEEPIPLHQRAAAGSRHRAGHII